MNKIMQVHWKILGEIYFMKKKKNKSYFALKLYMLFFIISNVNFIPGDKCFKKMTL